MTQADLPAEELAVLLRDVLEKIGGEAAPPEPWDATLPFTPVADGRISATDQLNWWFRPALPGRDPWDGFFESASASAFDAGPAPTPTGPRTAAPAPVAEPPGRWTALRLLLAEPEDEILEADADAVVTCLYDFVHAVGRGDVAEAMEVVADDYHAMDDDDEIDRDTLAARLRSMLDPFEGWELRSSLVEIPHPIPHPEGILVYAEMLLEARHPGTDERRSVLERRIAVFRKARHLGWRISALSRV